MKIPWPHWFLSQKEHAVNTFIKYCLSLSLIFKTNCQIEECHFTQCLYITQLSTLKRLPNWEMPFCTVFMYRKTFTFKHQWWQFSQYKQRKIDMRCICKSFDTFYWRHFSFSLVHFPQKVHFCCGNQSGVKR